MPHQDQITSVAIHPAIGIARVGNSPQGWFLGPEAPGQPRTPAGNYRDAQGRILRQAARFRLYGLDDAGRVVREITAQEARIEWTVEVANLKADWFNFDQALDIPASRGDLPGTSPVASLRRNRRLAGADRAGLRIEPGARHISGTDTHREGGDPRHTFDSGCFMGRKVYLGELRTDEAGRLLFLGGRGHSSSYDGQPPQGFANNDGWHDDICDGPVNARVTLGGVTHEAIGAWVVVAPPDYAPGVQALVTGWDLLRDLAVRSRRMCPPGQPDYWQDIHPLLRRLADTEWVNAGFALQFGWGTPQDFRSPGLRARLCDPAPACQPLRRAVFHSFREPGAPRLQADAWPAVYGDAVVLNPPITDPMNWMSITPLQYALLRQWADGDFRHVPAPPPDLPFDQMKPAEQAQALDRAALEETTGGPFHPGAEFTWPMRVALMYEQHGQPFRLRRRRGPEPDFGDVLTASSALAAGGPLDGCVPGGITRWMACPWQTDTASCLSAYKPWAGEYLPTFWPARVPNDVLTQAQYAVVMDTAQPLDQRLQALSAARREKWLRGIVYASKGQPPALIGQPNPRAVFIEAWSQVGIVLEQPAPTDLPLWPPTLRVETGRRIGPAAATAVHSLAAHDPTQER